ncbi:Fur family transcriptional regulator [Frondihabitans sp. VKM Ac-2883]|uniref:Fur family transcriptional regulator n=1 Tax=Frondihabitans sp. VKM Ac-2883 TaxID=2783823 RepID=UPI001889DDC8|nr:Fur family transcriptional regulator [Frondihabitans sp. VKM Ac-2883]MBF4575716.1 transcriptional repressor [Frondihabitans sp. VKM Ac-2883]
MTSLEASTRIRDAGLRVTAPRVAAIEALIDHSHATADEVFTRVAARLPGTSLQATYGVLAALTGIGILRRIEPAGSPARYELRTGDNHHHVVCSICGAIADVDCVVGEAPCLAPSSTSGYTVTTAEVTFWGLCPECRASELDGAAGAAEPSDPELSLSSISISKESHD